MNDASLDRAYAAQLGGVLNAVPPLDPEQLRLQREHAEQMERKYDLERAAEREALTRTQAENLRAQALHAALMCDYPCKDAETVIDAAGKIEAFLRGDVKAGAQH